VAYFFGPPCTMLSTVNRV